MFQMDWRKFYCDGGGQIVVDHSLLELIITVLCSVLASSGLWTFITKKLEKKDAKTKMILGLAHDRIILLGMKYIDRGWVTNDEYEDLKRYLYDPYIQLGGNGTAQRVMEIVDKLPMRHVEKVEDIDNEI